MRPRDTRAKSTSDSHSSAAYSERKKNLARGKSGPVNSQIVIPPDVWQNIRERFDHAKRVLAQEHEQVLAILEDNHPPVRNQPDYLPVWLSAGVPQEVEQGMSRHSAETLAESLPSEDVDFLREFDNTAVSATAVTPFDNVEADDLEELPAKRSMRQWGTNVDPKEKPPQEEHEHGHHYGLRPVWKKEQFTYHERISGKDSTETFGVENPFDVAGEAEFTGEGAMPSRIILHPNDYKRATWDLMSMGLVLYDIVLIPFSFFEPEQNAFLICMAWFTRIFWSCDVVLSFMSGFITKSGDIEMRAARIARRYLRTWFGLDIFVVSIDWIEWFVVTSLEVGFGMGRMSSATRVLRILRILRLLRMIKANAIMSLLAVKFGGEELLVFLEVFKLVVVMVSGAHCVACGFYAVGMDGTEDRSWPELFGYSDLSLRYRYIVSLRWGLSQFAGGMDEVQPVSFSEHTYSAFAFLLAFWIGSAIVSYLTSHVMHLDHLANHQGQLISQINMYLRQQGISKRLGFRVVRKAKHTLRMRRLRVSENASGIDDLVSRQLLAEVHFEMYWPLLFTHGFFKEFVTYNSQVVKRICHDAMSSQAYAIGDTIFHCGESAETMSIISAGQVSYTGEGHNDKMSCSAGTFFSEAVLWTAWHHHGTLTAVEDSQCSHLSAVHFAKIMNQFEILKFDVMGYATRFLEYLNSIEGPATDLPVVTNALRVRRTAHQKGEVFKTGPGAKGNLFLPVSDGEPSSRKRSLTNMVFSNRIARNIQTSIRGSFRSWPRAKKSEAQSGEGSAVVPCHMGSTGPVVSFEGSCDESEEA